MNKYTKRILQIEKELSLNNDPDIILITERDNIAQEHYGLNIKTYDLNKYKIPEDYTGTVIIDDITDDKIAEAKKELAQIQE